MVIFEIPSKQQYGGARIAVFGSCRVRNPASWLHDEGHARICGSGLKEIHSILELSQSISFILGETKIPDEFSPYIFELDATPDAAQLRKMLQSGACDFVAEISDSRQFIYRDLCLQQNFFSRRFVRPRGEAILPWYREISQGKAASEELVGKSMDRLKNAGFAHDARIEDILRSTRLVRISAAETSSTLSRVMNKVGGRWTLVGALTVPGMAGALMQDRRSLNGDLLQACTDNGARFFDPTELVVRHGRRTVLDGDGADLYEYARSFVPVVALNLLGLVQEDRPGTAPGSSQPIAAPTGPVSTTVAAQARSRQMTLAGKINVELVNLHRQRLVELGASASGLFSHYEQLLSQDLILGAREMTVASLVESYLPDYDEYGVMRAGLGELAFLIAAGGRRVIAYEPNNRRRMAIEAGLSHLQKSGVVEPGMMSVAGTLTPTEKTPRRMLGIALDASEVRDEAAAFPHLERCVAFEALIFDPRLFIRRRELVSEQENLLAELAARGFNGQRVYDTDRLVWSYRTDPDDLVV